MKKTRYLKFVVALVMGCVLTVTFVFAGEVTSSIRYYNSGYAQLKSYTHVVGSGASKVLVPDNDKVAKLTTNMVITSRGYVLHHQEQLFEYQFSGNTPNYNSISTSIANYHAK